SPVVVLNGLKATGLQNRAGFTTAPAIREFARQYVKWDWQTLSAAAVGEDVNRALKVAATAPRGPTYLGLPQDLLETPATVPVPPVARYRVAGRARPDPELVAAAARLLAGAARPLLVAGDEVATAGAVGDFLALAECLGAPVAAADRRSLEVKAIPADHAQYVGLYAPSSLAAREADVLFLAGTRTFLEFEASAEPPLPPGARVIHLSADPLEPGKRDPADVALVADARLALADLLAALERLPASPRPERDAYLRRAREDHAARLARWREATPKAEDVPIRVPALTGALAALLGPETTLVADAVTSSVAVLQDLLPVAGRYHTTASGSLGWGMGAALGLQLAAPADEVVAIVGDGVFLFGVQALWTAVAARLPVIYVVVNNRSYAAVKAALARHGGEAVRRGAYPATDLAGPDLAAIARGFGAFGRRVERLADLAPAIAEARAHGGPAVIEVLTDPGDIGPPPR
ncbi:MAG TPA: thiamine pyrophosphate-dependent enzyme, partial [Thermomicrobiales bacterium]|nr:thiamine pyrophosphate-dependent enzyme [Thermomicrobiales bacterium]